ncbi:ABC transporter permease [Candidatus Marinimicrobia bacterium]|nr:ABC transporter permease [Candidatus Neomarinimicrobiota bacterium]MDB3883670.1 ABC transporter permease [Candidatus Neomarinimicrobiota bacterium]
MKLVFLVLKRLFFSSQSNFLFKTTNIVSIISLALGIASLNIVLGAVSGFESKVSEKLSSISGYTTINHLFEDEFSTDQSLMPDFYSGFSSSLVSYVEKPAILKSKDNSSNILIYGLDKKDFKEFNLFSSLNTNLDTISENHIVVGSLLAKNLNLSIGDEIVIFNPLISKKGKERSRFLLLEIKEIYHSGIEDYDSRLVFIPINTVQSYFNLDDSITGWMNFDPSLNIDNVDYPFYQLRLNDRHSDLFEWIDTQQWPIIFIFSLIVLVSYFNLMGSINILFYEKRYNLAIMKTYGMSNSKISLIFIIQGMILAFIGAIFGILLSLFIIFMQEEFQFISLSENIYFVSYLPIIFSINNAIYTLSFSLICSVLFSSISLAYLLSINPSKILKN